MFHHRHFASVICVSIWAALGSVSLVRADGLSIAVTEDNGATIEIVDNGALDSDPGNGSITVIVDELNLLLTNFNFSSLRMTSNSSMLGSRPVLKITGTVVRATATGQISSILIQGTDASFTDQTVTRLRTTATEMFVNGTGGDQLTCRSYLDPMNQPFGKGIPGPTVKGVSPPVSPQPSPPRWLSAPVPCACLCWARPTRSPTKCSKLGSELPGRTADNRFRRSYAQLKP